MAEKRNNSMAIAENLKQFSQVFLAARKIWIAYSGGLDSRVLLHSVWQLCQSLNITNKLIAGYIHHGLYADADDWAMHCESVCKELPIAYQLIKVDVDRAPKKSLEESARIARYQALANLLQSNDLLLTAHHQDDQAETCLLQFLRGSGPKGLAAMPQVVPFADGFLLRPFLSVSRYEILNYAKQYSLSWIEDHSNHDSRFTRNFLRYRIMPLLQDRWPSVSKTIMRVAAHCAETDQLLRELASMDFERVQLESEKCLSISALKKLSLARQKNVLRYWLYQQRFPLPKTVKLNHIMHDVIESASDRQACVKWSDVEMRRYRDTLCLLRTLPDHDSSVILSWKGEETLKLPADIGMLKIQKTQGRGIRYSHEKITIRFRQPGETCRLPNRAGTKKLKKLFQAWNVPYWLRDRVPLIYLDDQLAAVVGYAICEPFVAREGETGLVITL